MARDVLTVFVAGRPAPQGSKRARPIYRGRGDDRQFTGRVAQQESSNALKPWRDDLRRALLDDEGQPVARVETDALSVRLHFVMPRPKSAPKRSTPAAIKRPDLDKLIRAVLDAIGSAGVWIDDAQVVDLVATKRIAEPAEIPGCLIYIERVRGSHTHLVDWRRIAIKLSDRAGLSDVESDALHDAVLDAQWLEAEVKAERTVDAADRGEESS